MTQRIALPLAAAALLLSGCNPDPAGRADPLEEPVSMGVELVRAADGTVIVSGRTNLPDWTKIRVSLQRGDYLAQSEITVFEGGFQSQGFTGHRGRLAPGEYLVSVDSALPPKQVPSVRAAIGEHGERLTGPATIGTGTRGQRVVRWQTQVRIP